MSKNLPEAFFVSTSIQEGSAGYSSILLKIISTSYFSSSSSLIVAVREPRLTRLVTPAVDAEMAPGTLPTIIDATEKTKQPNEKPAAHLRPLKPFFSDVVVNDSNQLLKFCLIAT